MHMNIIIKLFCALLMTMNEYTYETRTKIMATLHESDLNNDIGAVSSFQCPIWKRTQVC